ncbi:MAG: hypothetical protein G4V63_08285, partial [Candidatus Afipia apatlaquensis]|nr:hypothetical protein [Candidatus Afipia apatlaquensis]
MPRKPVIPAGSPPPMAPYSPGVVADNILYVSGVLAMDGSGKTVGVGDATAQTRAVLESIDPRRIHGAFDDVGGCECRSGCR